MPGDIILLIFFKHSKMYKSSSLAGRTEIGGGANLDVVYQHPVE